MSKCKWDKYEDYYDSQCGNQMDECDFDNVCPSFCPYCGDKIEF